MSWHSGTLDRRGEQIGELLRGTWRADPPPPAVSPTGLAELAPLLLDTAASSLAWWRIRGSELAGSDAGQALREGYLFHTLQAAVLEHQLADTLRRLRAAGVEPLLIKGWAVAQLYPEAGLRPYRDLDLCVRPEDYSRAMEALEPLDAAGYPLEVKSLCPDLEGTPVDELLSRSGTMALASSPIRCPGPEDHLRLLSVHMFRHGLTRPVWLCDVAALVEAFGGELDWDYCLREDYPGHCVGAAVGLAEQLLGAELPAPAAAAGACRLPPWLVPAVRRQWGSPVAERRSLRAWRSPRGLLSELRQRWPNPVSATVRCGRHFDASPRLPLQLAHYLRLGSRSLKALAERPPGSSDAAPTSAAEPEPPRRE
ncbi:MAG: nucleotidyltransferase family protein [Armatimonadota bacterium]